MGNKFTVSAFKFDAVKILTYCAYPSRIAYREDGGGQFFRLRKVLQVKNNNNNGPVAEWLGRALQKLVQQFESARDLTHYP